MQIVVRLLGSETVAAIVNKSQSTMSLINKHKACTYRQKDQYS